MTNSEQNQLIAEFLQWTPGTNGTYQVPNLYPFTVSAADPDSTGWTETDPEQMEFHRWDWLHPVVDRIKKMEHDPNHMWMGTTLDRWLAFRSVTELPVSALMGHIRSAILEFIVWWNKQLAECPKSPLKQTK